MSVFDRMTAAIESLYEDTCTVYVYEPYLVGKLTKHRQKVIYTDIRCRLSFSSSPDNTQSDTAAATVQAIKLFLNPSYSVPPGCKIEVTHKGSKTEYSASGQPRLYASHQEIELTLFKEWA
ncbi:hypothetical protein SDC9_170059 [bioreactor metagenome]|uniref:Minor capsid protein n=1 Tax=bioreactor metagenome TaxID=1076179 RepID=A0A645G990_9ZZZZ|nr:hypothetical protein [Candidatus Metalachnospira sp.]